MIATKHTIAILGGTGAEGSGLALRWAHAGHTVILGSRSPDKAAECVRQLNALLGRDAISWQGNAEAASAAQLVVLTVPFQAQIATVDEVREALAGKILVDATVPLVPPKVNRVQLPATGSAVAALQQALGAQVRVVSAFQNVSAHHLKDLAHQIDCDVLVCGDDPAARATVIALARDLGLRGVSAGPICNSAAAEALTSILISINMAYKVPGAGIRITGVPTLDLQEQPT
jgi:NADPH-dependent F420 reductase